MRALPAIAATQMIAFVTVAGLTRPGYDPTRNWVSQLSLGPGGAWATANMICCGLLLVLGGAAGFRATKPGRRLVNVGFRAVKPGSRLIKAGSLLVEPGGGLVEPSGVDGRRPTTTGSGAGRRLVAWCGFCLIVLAALPTDPGIGYPPDVVPAHTAIGFAHQVVAVILAASGVAAAAVTGRQAGCPRAGLVVAAVMAVSFVAATVLVLLDDAGVLPGNPSGLLERVALFLGLAWVGALALRTGRKTSDRSRGRAILAARSRQPETN